MTKVTGDTEVPIIMLYAVQDNEGNILGVYKTYKAALNYIDTHTFSYPVGVIEVDYYDD